MKLKICFSILLLFTILVGCQNNESLDDLKARNEKAENEARAAKIEFRKLQIEYDSLLKTNTELNNQINDLKEINQKKFLNQILDMASGVKDCDIYCDALEAHNSILAKANKTWLFDQNPDIDSEIVGTYYSGTYVVIFYPSGKYLAFRNMYIKEGSYTAKDGKLTMTDTIRSAGSEAWVSYQITNEGLIIGVIKPGNQSEVITFYKLTE